MITKENLSHGIAGKILKWLEDWLFERKQHVVINGNHLIVEAL